jgi:DNA (cytosine-5)-methyltransferase 1
MKARSVVSLFSGAGGMDIGLEDAGWSVLAQVEADADAAETLRAHVLRSGSTCRVIASKIEEVDPCALRTSLGLRRGELALIAGGPPCQPFTTTGLRRALNDARAVSLFPRYLEFVAEFRPRALLLENVDGMLSAALKHRPLIERGPESPRLVEDERKGSFLRWLIEQLGSQGYSVSWGVVEAADYGVPQMRQRAILIGVRGDAPCYMPNPTHGRPGLPAYQTLRSALASVQELGPVQPLSERKQEVYRRVPSGGNWRDLPVRAQRATMGAAFFAEGGKSGWWRRLSWDHPAPTLLGMPDHSSTALVHPDEVRCLSVNEYAAVQTFPPNMTFAGRPRSQYQQIGNAVPPRLAMQLGLQLARHLDGDRDGLPLPPAWRQLSSNRRIGTHGWALVKRDQIKYHLHVKVREDHVWAQAQQELRLG